MRKLLPRLAALAILSIVAVAGMSVASPSPASAAECGTTFAGFNGQMTQTYKNCWGGAWVTSAYQKSGGALHYFDNECRPAANGSTVTWEHPYTVSGATYTTVFCAPFAIYEAPVYSGGSLPCWTTFSPTSPQGGPMSHFYGNCGDYAAVAPAYRYPGGSWYIDDGWSLGLWPGQTVEWRYTGTEQNVNYTTVFAIYEPNLT
ncbi:MAG: hypothetical protein ACRDUA_07045 [Micromonosporaceae bacterium]